MVTQRVLQLFFYTKFFPIFSLLFGLGISMQALRLVEKNKLSTPFFIRRMFILFIIGVLHITLLWSGDVLNVYALIGLMTTFLIKKSNRLILRLSVFFLLFPFYDQILEALFRLISFKPGIYLEGYTGETVRHIIRNGTYTEGLKLRLLEYFSNIPMLFGFLVPMAISMFLLGLYLGKNKVYTHLDEFINQVKKPMLITALLTNIYRLSFLFILPQYDIYSSEAFGPVFIKLMIVSDVIMGLFYLWIMGWLWYNTKWKTILSPLRYVGKMALTNYIMHSLIGLILFSSVGFKLYEKLSPSQAFLTAFLVFVFQVIVSKFWLSFYRYGPLEWVWRCVSYKTLLPIKKKT